MKRKFLSLLLSACLAGGTLIGMTGCEMLEGLFNQTPKTVDYVAQTKLDMDSDSAKLEIIPENSKGEKTYTHIDGDTTHFDVPYSFDDTGKLKARYLAVDTPESTGDIEEWGKKASSFTKEKLASADSIILESNTDEWKRDTNERYLAWVWYRPEGETEYRLLNLELLQEGLAVGSSIEGGSVYSEACSKAASQAQSLKLYVHSNEQDPDYWYEDAVFTDLKEVRTNLDDFTGKRVVFECVVSAVADKGSIYVEEYYEEEDGTSRTYGLPIFYGYNNPSYTPLLIVGNRVRLVGEISYSETFGYQMSALQYDAMNPDDPNNIKVISKGNSPTYMTPTISEFIADDYAYAKDYQYSSVFMEGLLVKSVKTHESGELTFTCSDASGDTFKVHTNAFTEKNSEGVTVTVTADRFEGKTISVKGVIDTYYDTYQVNVYNLENIVIAD